MSSPHAMLAGVLCAAALDAGAGAPEACQPCALGCELVMTTGREDGGMDLAAVVDLNMRGWKPQSSHGIEILGWSSAPPAAGRCVVSYAYRDRTPVVIQWQVDLTTAVITPLSPLAERMQRMTYLLSQRAASAPTAAAPGRPEQPNDVNTKARKP